MSINLKLLLIVFKSLHLWTCTKETFNMQSSTDMHNCGEYIYVLPKFTILKSYIFFQINTRKYWKYNYTISFGVPPIFWHWVLYYLTSFCPINFFFFFYYLEKKKNIYIYIYIYTYTPTQYYNACTKTNIQSKSILYGQSDFSRTKGHVLVSLIAYLLWFSVCTVCMLL